MIVLGYTYTLQSPNAISYNLLHNFGYLYDDTYSMIKLLTIDYNTTSLDWYKGLSTDIGSIMSWTLLYP